MPCELVTSPGAVFSVWGEPRLERVPGPDLENVARLLALAQQSGLLTCAAPGPLPRRAATPLGS